MKRIILLVCLIAGTLGAYSQVTWNLKAGVGLSALEGTNYEGDNSIRIVGKIGVGMEVPLNRNLSFMPSLEFAMKGGNGLLRMLITMRLSVHIMFRFLFL